MSSEQQPPKPASPPLYLSTVYRCESPTEADARLAGHQAGPVYVRDGHPNADLLAQQCGELHGVPRAAIAASGMAALAAALISQTRQGDHVVLSSRLYGRSMALFGSEAARLGIASTVVDASDLKAVDGACTARTRLVLVETISNPTLRVADIPSLAEIAHRRGARLLVDNTFASPAICRPYAIGADLVMESLTKIMNGHSDVMLGMLGGAGDAWERVPGVLSTWGWSSSPFECWLAGRGLGTLELRVERAAGTAMRIAELLAGHRKVEKVDYPGLSEHPDHALAARLFSGRFGWMATFHLHGGLAAAERLIAAGRIPFFPSLGELQTTLSHPASTSHRALSPEDRAVLGITDGTIRLSVGIEPAEQVLQALEDSLAAV